MILRVQTKTVVLVHRLADGSATATLAMAAATAAASGFLSTASRLARLIFLSRAVQALSLAIRSSRSVAAPLFAKQPAHNLLLYLVGELAPRLASQVEAVRHNGSRPLQTRRRSRARQWINEQDVLILFLYYPALENSPELVQLLQLSDAPLLLIPRPP